MGDFAARLVRWQRRHGRHGLPWQGTGDPYRVWVAEVMLQQTQVATVVPYYLRFLARFPDVSALARAPRAEVLRLWSGLGYYARARNLHEAARRIVCEHGTRLPSAPQALARLPGIGRTTAAAIAVFAFGRRAAILDGNVRRVLARHYGVEPPSAQWPLAEALLPRREVARYTQALMDLGATVCTRRAPACHRCPVAETCIARREGRTEELPRPRAARPRPLVRVAWVVALERGRVLLVRRGAEGLWGGLWCFPELPAARAAARLRALAGARARITPLARVRHEFTHRRLAARPFLVCGAGRCIERATGAGERRWLALERAAEAAVPAPVRALLRGLARHARQ